MARLSLRRTLSQFFASTGHDRREVREPIADARRAWRWKFPQFILTVKENRRKCRSFLQATAGFHFERVEKFCFVQIRLGERVAGLSRRIGVRVRGVSCQLTGLRIDSGDEEFCGRADRLERLFELDAVDFVSGEIIAGYVLDTEMAHHDVGDGFSFEFALLSGFLDGVGLFISLVQQLVG